MNKVLLYNQTAGDTLTFADGMGGALTIADLSKPENAGKEASLHLHKVFNPEDTVFDFKLPTRVELITPGTGAAHPLHSTTLDFTSVENKPIVGDRANFSVSILNVRTSGSSQQQSVVVEADMGYSLDAVIADLVSQLNRLPDVHATVSNKIITVTMGPSNQFDLRRAAATRTDYSNNIATKQLVITAVYTAPTTTLDERAISLYRTNYSVMTGRNIVESGGMDHEQAALEPIVGVTGILKFSYSTRTTSTSPISGGVEPHVAFHIICIGTLPS